MHLKYTSRPPDEWDPPSGTCAYSGFRDEQHQREPVQQPLDGALPVTACVRNGPDQLAGERQFLSSTPECSASRPAGRYSEGILLVRTGRRALTVRPCPPLPLLNSTALSITWRSCVAFSAVAASSCRREPRPIEPRKGTPRRPATLTTSACKAASRGAHRPAAAVPLGLPCAIVASISRTVDARRPIAARHAWYAGRDNLPVTTRCVSSCCSHLRLSSSNCSICLSRRTMRVRRTTRRAPRDRAAELRGEPPALRGVRRRPPAAPDARAGRGPATPRRARD